MFDQIAFVWEEKEACYVNGEYDSNVSLALLSNAYKIITRILRDYKDTLMRNEVKQLFNQKVSYSIGGRSDLSL